jgi:predicted secreted protein
MAYNSKVIEIMIASPSDVERERQITKDIIHEWNNINSRSKNIVLLPTMWETHASPRMGERAQELINNEVLKDCDLLIGIFWTRIGTPTGEFRSGTVEEIEEHVQSGKPAMIYFSSAPVLLDNVNQQQYSQLKLFKDECKGKGLIEEYDSINDFHNKFTRHLSLRLLNDQYLQTLIGEMGNELDQTYHELIGSNLSNDRSIANLSSEAKELLMEASNSQDGIVWIMYHSTGLHVKTNEKFYGEENNRRSQATWESAVKELADESLLQDRGYKGKFFELTGKGYKVAEVLKSMI